MAISSQSFDDQNQYEYPTQVFFPDSPQEMFVASFFGHCTVIVESITSSFRKSIENEQAEDAWNNKLQQTIAFSRILKG